jgi:hypothetical protein
MRRIFLRARPPRPTPAAKLERRRPQVHNVGQMTCPKGLYISATEIADMRDACRDAVEPYLPPELANIATGYIGTHFPALLRHKHEIAITLFNAVIQSPPPYERTLGLWLPGSDAIVVTVKFHCMYSLSPVTLHVLLKHEELWEFVCGSDSPFDRLMRAMTAELGPTYCSDGAAVILTAELRKELRGLIDVIARSGRRQT